MELPEVVFSDLVERARCSWGVLGRGSGALLVNCAMVGCDKPRAVKAVKRKTKRIKIKKKGGEGIAAQSKTVEYLKYTKCKNYG